MIKYLSKLHWTRYKTISYRGTKYETEYYYGFYLSSSPCAVGGVNVGIWNRNIKLTLAWGLKDLFVWSIY